jgi:hypothetical protein
VHRGPHCQYTREHAQCRNRPTEFHVRLISHHPLVVTSHLRMSQQRLGKASTGRRDTRAVQCWSGAGHR